MGEPNPRCLAAGEAREEETEVGGDRMCDT